MKAVQGVQEVLGQARVRSHGSQFAHQLVTSPRVMAISVQQQRLRLASLQLLVWRSTSVQACDQRQIMACLGENVRLSERSIVAILSYHPELTHRRSNQRVQLLTLAVQMVWMV